ncbi:MAG: biotin/lipoyl-binding protein [Bacteroidales bacterium]|nr:biotin/lipoyl-binding protein [Bacteroidales bacterium]
MKKRPIKFSLVYRDMWQSSGKYVPRVDQLTKIAPLIIDMGCFARVETNGGAFEQVNLLYGENPNKAVREWTQPFNDVGIKTHMLERALNGIRMFPVPADVRQLMFKVKKAQGTDISRSFCGLNDPRNLELSVKYAREAGMISQASLCITYSKIHTVDYYMDIVDKVVEFGADEICLKDMAGIGRPAMLGKLTKTIKDKYPNIIIQYHGHTGPGFSVASMLEVAKNGADYVDVAMEPLSWGMVHPDVITIQAMLKDAGFEVPEINMKAYMEARAMTQSFMDDFLGYFINPKNKLLSSLMVSSGLPGGMMGSLMADLKGVQDAINFSLKADNKPELSEDDLLVKLFDETAYVWPKLGYPPLVTPFSQYVKNVALLNIVQMAKGEERYSMIDENSWNMILGKAGKLPGPLAPEIVELAKKQGKEFYTGVPQDAYPNVLDDYRKQMKENNWDTGEDDEELLEFAMHEGQYRDYKSGLAKKRFEEEVEKMKNQATTSTVAVKGNKTTKKTSYNMKEVDYPFAMAAFTLYSMNTKLLEDKAQQHDIWKSIGYWRNITKIDVGYDDKTIVVNIKEHKPNEYNLEIEGVILDTKIDSIEAGQIDVNINNETYKAKISAGEDGFTKVNINDKEFLFSRNDLLDGELAASDEEDVSTDGEKNILAPLPGRIFKINVKEGDKIQKGDVVLIIDAMKMENNIVTKKDAVVKKILVKLDDMVEASTPLIEIE